MSNQSYQQKQPFLSRQTFSNKPNIPEKKINSEEIKKLFAEVSSGNYLKIKQFLLLKKMSMSLKNTNDESVLHIIIKSSNTTPQEKLELVKLAITNGAQIVCYDQNNVTPLHLACQYQLYDVVKLLLDYSANVKSEDSQLYTPLHYAVIGNDVQCIDEEKERVKPLIPKSSIKYDKIQHNKNINLLQKQLHNFLHKDQHTKIYIEQLKNTINIVDEMFPQEFEKFEDDNKKNIMKVLLDSSTVDKNQAIFEKVSSLKVTTIDNILQFLGDGISPLKIEPNIYNGWGPGDNNELSIFQQNRILPYRSLEELIVNIDTTIDNKKSSITKEMEIQLKNVTNQIQKFGTIFQNLNFSIQHSVIYSFVIGNVLETNPDIRNIGTSMKNLTVLQQIGYLFYTDPLKSIDCPIVNETLIYFPDIQENETRLYEMPYNNTFTILQNIKTLTFDNPERSRILKSEEQRLGTGNFQKAKLSLPLNNVGSMFIQRPMPEVIVVINDVPILHNNYITRGVYFDTKIRFYFELLKNYFEQLKNLCKNMFNLNFKDMYENISTGVCHILTILLCLRYINAELEPITSNLSTLYIYFNDKNVHLRNDPRQFLIEQITDELQSTINSIDKLNSDIDNFYDQIVIMVKTFNRILGLIGDISAKNILHKYFKYDGTINFDQFYIENKTEIVNKIIDRPIEKIQDLPSTFTDFVKLLPSELIDAKKMLISYFVPQISTKNYPTYYDTPIVQRINHKPKIGFLPMWNIQQKMNRWNVKEILIRYNSDTGQYYNVNIEPKESKRGMSLINDPNVNTYVGSIGKKINIFFNKDEPLPPIIGSFINVYIQMLKYSIIRWILKESYNLIEFTTPIFPTHLLKHYEELKESINNVINDIKQTISFSKENCSFILVLIGKYVDAILNNYIKDHVLYKSNTLMLNFLEQKNTKINFKDLDLIKNVIPTEDTGFFLDLNDTFDSVMEIFMYNKENEENEENEKYLNALTAGLLIDNPKKEKYINKMINFNFEINSLEQSCFKVDPNIIDLLIKNGAYLNAKDSIGNTALYYAIDTQNITIIEMLLNAGSIVFNKNYVNKMGQNVLSYVWEKYATILQTLMVNKYAVCEKLTNNLLEKFKKKGDTLNNIPKYSDMLLPMALYMLNHQMYLIGKGYPKNWNFDLNELFEDNVKLKSKKQYGDVLPILDVNVTDKDISNLEIPNIKIKYIEEVIDVNNKKVKEYENRNTYLGEELNSLNIRNKLTENEEYRKKELEGINGLINDNKKEILKLKKFVEDNEKLLEKYKYGKNITFDKLKNFLKNNKHKIIRKNDVVDIYDSLFYDVINEGDIRLKQNSYDYNVDIKTYPILWEKFMCKYLNPTEKTKNYNSEDIDYTQIIDIITTHQKDIIFDNSVDVSNKLAKFDIIEKYYKNIIYPFADDYFNLPKEYNFSNYPMTKIMNIVIHIVKRIICVNLYGTILKGLTKYIISIFPYYNKNFVPNSNDKNVIFNNETDYYYYVMTLIFNIINDEGHGIKDSRLLKYIFTTLPTKVVKIILEIYEGENEGEEDPDRNTNLELIFDYISTILESTTVIDLKKDTTFLTNLKNYVYPYFISYLELFVKEMFNLISNYLRSLQYQGKMIHILQKISNHAKNEMKQNNL